MAPSTEELLAVPRVTPAELAALIERSTLEGCAPPLMVDVRDEDFELKGHVRGTEHLPQENFVEDAAVDALVKRLAPLSSEFVFHCGRGNTRGPTCALRFMARLDAARLAEGVVKPRVRVLAGEFPELLEGVPEARPPIE